MNSCEHGVSLVDFCDDCFFDTGCTEDCPDDCMADHQGEE